MGSYMAWRVWRWGVVWRCGCCKGVPPNHSVEDDALIQIGGTRPWIAPEANRPVAKRLLSFTDTFSFGLLVWKVLIDGLNPFVLLLGRVPDREIDRLKGTDELLCRSRLMTWFPTWLPTYLQTHGVQHDQTLLTTEFA